MVEQVGGGRVRLNALVAMSSGLSFSEPASGVPVSFTRSHHSARLAFIQQCIPVRSAVGGLLHRVSGGLAGDLRGLLRMGVGPVGGLADDADELMGGVGCFCNQALLATNAWPPSGPQSS